MFNKIILFILIIFSSLSVKSQSYEQIDFEDTDFLFPYDYEKFDTSLSGYLIWNMSTPDITFKTDDAIIWGLRENIPVVFNRQPKQPNSIKRSVWDFRQWTNGYFTQTFSVGKAIVYNSSLEIIDSLQINDPHAFDILDSNTYVTSGSISDTNNNITVPFVSFTEAYTHNTKWYWDPFDPVFNLNLKNYPQQTCLINPTDTINGFIDWTHYNSVATYRNDDTIWVGVLNRNISLIIILKVVNLGGVWKTQSIRKYNDDGTYFNMPHDLEFIDVKNDIVTFSLFDNGPCKPIPSTGVFIGDLYPNDSMVVVDQRLYGSIDTSNAMGSGEIVNNGQIIANVGAWFPFESVSVAMFGFWDENDQPLFTVKRNFGYSLYSIDYAKTLKLPRPITEWKNIGDSILITIIPEDSTFINIKWADGYSSGANKFTRVVKDSSEVTGIKALAYVSKEDSMFWFASERIMEFDISTDIDEIYTSFKVYPNPISNHLVIDGNIEEATILDTKGEVLITSQSNRIDVSELIPGVYFLYLKENNKISTIKLVKF